MDHRTALAALSVTAKNTLQQRSDRAGLMHLAGYMFALCATSLWIITKAPFWQMAILPQGVLLMFLFTLSHECTHYTPFKTRWINDVTGHAVSLPLILPFTWFRYFHLAHHRHTNDPQNDPELEHGPRPETWHDFMIYLSGWGYWRAMCLTLLRNACGIIQASYLPTRKHTSIRREACILLIAYLFIGLSLTMSSLALYLWIIPALIGQPFLRLYLLAEHGHCPLVANMLANSRTTFTNRLVRALAWNMPYHAEHHSFPNVPFHQLPHLHKSLKPHLQSTSESYTTFAHSYSRSLK